jgi:hypothetical protein
MLGINQAESVLYQRAMKADVSKRPSCFDKPGMILRQAQDEGLTLSLSKGESQCAELRKSAPP